MAPRVCPNKSCKGTSFAYEIQSGEYCCTNCGTVVEESNIVSEITFGESSAGAITVTGSFVGADQAHAGSGGLHGHQGESRLQTIEKTKRRINALAAKLQIQEHISGNAMQHFKLALSHNFVKGRKSHYVVSACLYLSCRIYKTDHMLMDFAEAIFVNVFSIGSTYLQLLKCLGIYQIPTMDPVFFIQRFISKLALSPSDSNTVKNDASRLTQRMGKDWLTIGRRPTGVAAACVLLACRMNNIRVSKAQIVQIAKVGETTVQRRLDEFSNTSAGGLAVGTFRATMIESSADPPSFTRRQELNRKASEKLAKEQEALERGDIIDSDLMKMAREIDENLSEVGQALGKEVQAAEEAEGTNSQTATGEDNADAEGEANAEVETTVEANTETTSEADATTEATSEADAATEATSEADAATEATSEADAATEATSEAVAATEATSEAVAATEASGEVDAEADKGNEEDKNESENEFSDSPQQKSKNKGKEKITDAAAATSETGSTGNSTATTQPKKQPSRAVSFLERYRAQKAEAIAAALAAGNEDIDLSGIGGGIIGRVRENEGPKWVSEVPDDPLCLSDVDDDEVNASVLTASEIEIKTQVWMTMNRDYLIEQENKRLKLEADAAAGIIRAPKKRKKNAAARVKTSTYKLQDGALPSAAETAQQVLKQKAFSKKLNYEAVSTFLFKTGRQH
ncbi:transcription factor TFIIIB subunit BRF1 [Sugiyamaella lignohabitans]|uniref:B-related factor 1 n=1 Tax=Sugiyamaella lignohabitans TaxID=796027 RepID=A0A167D3M9_9ASCO|nr:transcription factor TFIIIB subunit BRF1 [Sugiyamaella lignohabitans]ANB12436.1 transcription factor TFIIIB subunit BRF1 [Sugiyamaella lignohabitans]